MNVAFAVMPFADIGRPALGVSLLKQAVLDAGHSARVHYASLRLAQRMGAAVYQKISSAFPPELLLGEWFFADAVFGDEIAPPEDYVQTLLAPFADAPTLALINAARLHVSAFLDEAAAELAATGAQVVGFTTTFHQTCPSLAVARRLKSLAQPPVIVFGGANCEGEMGLQMLQSFPWIDFVCSGESDLSFPALLLHLQDRSLPLPAGVYARGGASALQPSLVVEDLDELPIPDFDDYFAQLEGGSLGRDTAYHLVVETSRGCWWGAKHHCTFCGLNGETMRFRAKSPRRAADEIMHLCRKHGLVRVGAVDNILDLRYIDTVFPELAASGLQLEMFYEVKSNLTREQLRGLHAGGMRQIQPGIESFSDEVLRLMEKGVSGLQNIQLMRWCTEFGIQCAWNLLSGFPGESESEYDAMAELVPLLTHLDPPSSCAQLRLDRFSPFHSRAQAFGMHRVRPSRAYFYVFPLSRRELMRLAYFFDFDYADGRDPARYMRPVQQAVSLWWQARADADRLPLLDAHFEGDGVRVVDTRAAARAPEHRLTGAAATILALCDVAATVPTLLRDPRLAGRALEVEQALDDLQARGLLIRRDKRFLSLPVFRNRPDDLPTHRAHAHIAIAPAAAAEPLQPVV
jgi:ribosomal peptide maturation radical SAM protein 1